MKFIPYVLKTLWRHRSRTLLTVSGAAVALFVFSFVGSIQEGMSQLQERQAAGQSLVVFQANKFCPATSHLPEDYDQKILPLDGVREVVPIQVFTNNCRASLDIVVFYGIPPEKLRKVRDFELVEGSWSDFETHQDAAVMGEAVAARRNVDVGDKFSIGELTVNIAAIYSSENPAEENYVYSHLEFLQRGEGMDLVGTVTQHEVLLSPGVDADAVCAKIDEMFKAGPVETYTRPKGVFQAKSLGDLTQMLGMAQYLAYVCVGLVVAIVATTTIMSVQDRIKEHAVLQTLGFSGPRVFGLVLLESVLLGVAGGLIGVLVAVALLKASHLSVGAQAVAVAFTPSLDLVVRGVGVSLLAGLVAGIMPALHAARTNIVEGLRSV